ncbi:hypothetical protein, partial [Salmonella sp. s54836]|uniref:hypothetical protein n=1 Tax=Salmonella sp. s54836 TaxID=3159673 RepID=UPI0039813A48
CVYLKNTIARSWKEHSLDEFVAVPPYVIPEEDKIIMKEATISALSLCDDSTLKSLCYCIELISKNDFPKKWPDLLQKLKAMLESDSPQEWNASVLTLYQVGRKYQYKPDNERAEFLGVIQTLIP